MTPAMTASVHFNQPVSAIRREGERWIATKEVADADIPDTIHGLLLARIDRLPPEIRRTLRVASVIGRQFPATVLADVVSGS